jgi:manganese/iron transport system permease protein/iron/zinc/copper transport system permease protein
MIDTLYQLVLEPLLHHTYFAKALLAGSLVAMVCGVIGCFIILRRMAFLGDAIAHAMLAGVTAGYLFMQIAFGKDAHAPAMLVGSILAGFVTVAMIGFVSKATRIKDDTAIGIMYTGIFALGGVLASLFSDRIHIDLLHFVMGQVLAVGNTDLWMMAVVTAIVLGLVILFFRHLQLTSFDPIMAASIGIPVVAVNYLLTTCTSLVVVSAVQIVGVILVVGLLVTPAATAYLLSDRLGWMLVVASLFGVTSVVGGLYLSEWIDVATGSAIVVFSTFQFLVVLIVAPRYGLVAGTLRRRALVPQRLAEDVLGYLSRCIEKPVPVASVLANVDGRSDQIRRALRSLERGELIDVKGDGLRLTKEGRREASRLLRAHRLWETYLEHVGTPSDQLHAQAHLLEHASDEATIDYLDDKLGHPLHDPHGAMIPEDFVDLVPGAEVKASLLREGRAATISGLAPQARSTSLRVGMRITAGPRQDEGRQWTFVLDDKRQIVLDHATADAVTVRLDERKDEGRRTKDEGERTKDEGRRTK